MKAQLNRVHTGMNLKLQLHLGSPAEEYIVESKNGWRLLTRNGAIEIKPLVDYEGEPLTELPVFDRADIFPVPPEPDFAKLHPKEAQTLRRSHQLWARESNQPEQTPDRERRETNIELERKHGPPSDYPRGLLTVEEILALKLRHQNRDLSDLLQRIRYRAEFWHGEKFLGVYLSACGVDVLTLEERSILPSCIEAQTTASAQMAQAAVHAAKVSENMVTKSALAKTNITTVSEQVEGVYDRIAREKAEVQMFIEAAGLKENPRQTRAALKAQKIPEELIDLILHALNAGHPVPSLREASKQLTSKCGTREGFGKSQIAEHYKSALPILKAAGYAISLLPGAKSLVNAKTDRNVEEIHDPGQANPYEQAAHAEENSRPPDETPDETPDSNEPDEP